MKYQKPLWLQLVVLALLLVFAAAVAPAPAAEEIVPNQVVTEEKDIQKSLAPYVPTPQAVVEEMLKLADVRSTDVVYDLGCGDGRIVVTAAKKFGARGVGVDYDAVRVREALENVKAAGVQEKVTIIQHDAMTAPLTSATVVTLYLLPDSNAKLRPRLEQFLPVGARVVSHDFDMPVWKAVEVKRASDDRGGQHTLYLWKITPEIKERAAAAPPAPAQQ